MNKMFKEIGFFCLFIILIPVITFAQSSEAAESDVDLFYRKCAYCHQNDVPPQKERTKDEWMALVKTMQAKEQSNISDAEAERIAVFLVSSYGKESPVHRIKNPADMSESEKKHIPVINTGEENKENKTVTITVNVGEVPHPMEEGHYIKNIRIYINNFSAGSVDLKPGDKPEAVFVVPAPEGKKIIARAVCSLHGIWESK